jgi:hypothetical protein
MVAGNKRFDPLLENKIGGEYKLVKRGGFGRNKTKEPAQIQAKIELQYTQIAKIGFFIGNQQKYNRFTEFIVISLLFNWN